MTNNVCCCVCNNYYLSDRDWARADRKCQLDYIIVIWLYRLSTSAWASVNSVYIVTVLYLACFHEVFNCVENWSGAVLKGLYEKPVESIALWHIKDLYYMRNIYIDIVTRPYRI